MVKTVLPGRGSYVPSGAQCLGFCRKNLAKTLTNILFFLSCSCHLWSLFLHCITGVKNITSYLYSALNILLEVDELYDVPQRHPTKPQYCWPHDTWRNNLIPHKSSILWPIHLFFQSWSCLHRTRYPSCVSYCFPFDVFNQEAVLSAIMVPECKRTTIRKAGNRQARLFRMAHISLKHFWIWPHFLKNVKILNYVYLYWVNRDFDWTYFRLIVHTIKFVFDEI